MQARRAFLALAVVALAAPLAHTALADDVTFDKLFFIQRSKNANEVHYDARVAKDGALDKKEPVVGYWINKAEDNSRGPITLVQRIAYGFDVSDNGNGTYAMSMKALPDRKITITKVNGKYRGQTTIGGKPAYLKRLFVKADDSSMMPTVIYVDLFGEEVNGGAAITERINK
jgi:hypothetical protein